MTLSFRTNSAGTLSFTIDGESCAGSDNIEVLLNNVSIEYGNVCNFSDDEIRSSSLSANTDYELVFNYSDPSQAGGGVYINDITFTGVDASSISVTQNDGWTQN